jgi:hypothetical protein
VPVAKAIASVAHAVITDNRERDGHRPGDPPQDPAARPHAPSSIHESAVTDALEESCSSPGA